MKKNEIPDSAPPPYSVCINHNYTQLDEPSHPIPISALYKNPPNEKEVIERLNILEERFNKLEQNNNNIFKKLVFDEVGRKFEWKNEYVKGTLTHEKAAQELNLLENEFVIDWRAWAESGSTIWWMGITNLSRTFKASQRDRCGHKNPVNLEGEPVLLSNEYIKLIVDTSTVVPWQVIREGKYYQTLVNNYKKFNIEAYIEEQS